MTDGNLKSLRKRKQAWGWGGRRGEKSGPTPEGLGQWWGEKKWHLGSEEGGRLIKEASQRWLYELGILQGVVDRYVCVYGVDVMCVCGMCVYGMYVWCICGVCSMWMYACYVCSVLGLDTQRLGRLWLRAELTKPLHQPLCLPRVPFCPHAYLWFLGLPDFWGSACCPLSMVGHPPSPAQARLQMGHSLSSSSFSLLEGSPQKLLVSGFQG